MVLVLQTELSNRQMHSTLAVGLQSVPVRQHVESCHSEGKSRLEIGPDSVSHMLEMTYGMKHREHSLDHHTRVPFTSLAHHQVGRVALLEGEQLVSQNDHLLLISGNYRVEDTIMHVSGSTIPIHNQAPLVEK